MKGDGDDDGGGRPGGRPAAPTQYPRSNRPTCTNVAVSRVFIIIVKKKPVKVTFGGNFLIKKII